MIAFVFKNLNSLILKHTSPMRRSATVSFLLSPRFFSKSADTQLGTSPTIIGILLHKYSFPPELASRVASDFSHLKNFENRTDSILSFFKERGFSNTQLVKIVKYKPGFLSASLEDNIKPKIKLFQDKGFSSDDIAKIISSNPPILSMSMENYIIPSLSVLKSLLGSDAEVARVIRKCPWLLARNIQNNLRPNVDFFKSCGIPMERILIILRAQPWCFAMKPETISKSSEKAKEMGLNSSSENFIYAISTIARMSDDSWELKLQAFRDLGFSGSEISTMFSKAPQVFYLSIENIKKSTKILLGTGKFNICTIVNCANSLAYSTENRYIPRFQILEILESKNLIKNWPALGTLGRMSDDKFFQKFIGPYSDAVGHLCIKKSSSRGKEKIKP